MSEKRYFNEILSQNASAPVAYYKAIDWNQVEDMIGERKNEKNIFSRRMFLGS